MLNLISLGAGVQSSALALMFARGDITPMPDGAIFADTGAEPRAVYEWLDKLDAMLPFPVHRVMWQDGLTKSIERSTQGGRFAGAPFFAHGADGRPALLRRQCTREFKVQPIERKIRELVGLKPEQRGPKQTAVIQYIGISIDEWQRQKPSQVKWIERRWPLVERRISRTGCLEYLAALGIEGVAKSACVYCPFHDNNEWRHLRDTDQEGFAEACRVDELVRNGVKGSQDELYVHRSMKPLALVDLRTDFDRGQGNLWQDECEGMCGV